MFNAARQMRVEDRPPLQFAAVVLAAPTGWDGWGRMRVTALNYAAIPADLRQICRKLRLGGRIVSMLEVARYDPVTQTETWPPAPRGGKHNCSDISEYRVAQARGTEPGAASFDVLIRPGKGLGKLGYKVRYRWSDKPTEIQTGIAQP
ncbi:hypothetical protein [Paracoccus sp. MC1862]|uniref:hypothetical protein n=1 Tax=Paracoccus sp. MC1862 TaxID=2760307 RepID=UPI0016045DB1|nr:hypothetical protein [Paracoccus sp. MC1862]MBB1497903.1 hypothetical protein [Paracoccus sp. MC1862]QQO44297.1 hypothetical protein JGR78_13115 [Paracoccus sp. MC1862]